MARQVKPAHLLDFSRQHHVMLSGWCLQPKAGTNQATAATAAVAASASAAYAFVAPAFTIAVSVPATVAPATVSATSPLLLQGAVAAFASATAPLPLSSCWQMPQLLLYHCHACWQMQNSFCSVTVMAAGRCKTAFASLSMPLSLVFMAHLHIAPPIAIDLLSLPWRDSRKYQRPLACLAVLWRPQLWHESWDTRYFCLLFSCAPLVLYCVSFLFCMICSGLI